MAEGRRVQPPAYLRSSRFAARETALSILLSAARLWESRALISQTKRLLKRRTAA
jgi:hypothetical protein